MKSSSTLAVATKLSYREYLAALVGGNLRAL